MIKIENSSVVGTVRRLQIGQVMPFVREQVSAINKYAVDKVTVTTTGCIGDEQGDPFSMVGNYRQFTKCLSTSIS